MNKKIVIFCPYFGNFPNYSTYTFFSMEKNHHIDWVIFTDNDCSTNKYQNVKFVQCKFTDLQKKIKERIGTKLSSPYKLCDYKPVYGKLFEEYVQGYEFWGYCDLDVIFGDLLNYFSLENLNKYDKIFDTGHLSICRNIPEINNIFLKLDTPKLSYKKILNSNESYVFDESYGRNHISINEILEDNGYRVMRNRSLFADTVIRYKNLYIVNTKRKPFLYFHYIRGKVYLEQVGTQEREEYAYVHFQKRHFENVHIKTACLDDFVVTPRGFFNYLDINKNLFYKPIMDLRLGWYIRFRLSRKFSNIKKKFKEL